MRRGAIVAEIQENSDITYRLYDYNRVGNDGKMRPLKLDKALEVMDYAPDNDASFAHVEPETNGVVNLKRTPFFTTNLMTLTRKAERDYAPLDSFVAYMCVGGGCKITALDGGDENKTVPMEIGEAVLVPAALNDILIEPDGECKLIEIYMEL
jgi:mannose-6-phosphate isomerase